MNAATMAPTVSPRETRKPEFPATVHAYTDVLRRLTDGPSTAEALAKATERVPSNLRRDAQKLRDAGVIQTSGAADAILWSLTDKGRRWITGIEVAEGRAEVGRGAQSVHLVQLAPDPDQPRKTFDEEELAQLADSIAEKGLLQPILVRPAGPNRLHTIIAGERRYRAIVGLSRQGRWSSDRKVPIRIATPDDEAEVMELALVENTQRSDLNHMELALGYQRLADLGRTPKQIAAVVGRTNDHVTQHLRLTRLKEEDQAAVAAGTLPLHQALEKLREPRREPEAPTRDGTVREWTTHDVHRSPFGLEDGDTDPMITIILLTDGQQFYARSRYRTTSAIQMNDGAPLDDDRATLLGAIADLRSWPSLPRAAREWLDGLEGPFVVDGVPCYNATQAQERRYALGWDQRQSNGGARVGSGGPAGQTTAESKPASAWPKLSARAQLALIELAHKVAVERRPLTLADDPEWTGDREADHTVFGASVGAFWLDGAHGELTAVGLATFAHVRGGLPPIAALTVKGVAFLIDQAVPLPLDERTLERFQLASGLGLTLHVTYETPWLQEVAQGPANPSTDAETDDGQMATVTSIPSDPWNRTPEQIAEDERLDAQVALLSLGDPLVDIASLFADFGITTAQTRSLSDDDIGLIFLSAADGSVVTTLTIDQPGELPEGRARALADLVAHQLSAVLS